MFAGHSAPEKLVGKFIMKEPFAGEQPIVGSPPGDAVIAVGRSGEPVIDSGAAHQLGNPNHQRSERERDFLGKQGELRRPWRKMAGQGDHARAPSHWRRCPRSIGHAPASETTRGGDTVMAHGLSSFPAWCAMARSKTSTATVGRSMVGSSTRGALASRPRYKTPSTHGNDAESPSTATRSS